MPKKMSCGCGCARSSAAVEARDLSPARIKSGVGQFKKELRAISKNPTLLDHAVTDVKKRGYLAIGVRAPFWIQNGKFLGFFYNSRSPLVVQKDFLCQTANDHRVVPREDVDPNIRYLGHCSPSSRGQAARLLIKYVPK